MLAAIPNFSTARSCRPSFWSKMPQLLYLVRVGAAVGMATGTWGS